MRVRNSARSQPAFTRVELLVVLAVLTLLIAVVLPALANSRLRSDRVICANNLRQIGGAFQLWGNDHNDLFPQEVPVADGGTRQHSLAPNAWLHFSWISNELATPKVLFCPSDTGRPAYDFTGDPNGGYIHPNFANRATSYFLSHAFNNGPIVLLAGDRNVGFDGSSSCSRFVTTLFASASPVLSPNFQWNTDLHNNAGNVLRFDGRVEQLSNTGLRDAAFASPLTDQSNIHFLRPR